MEDYMLAFIILSFWVLIYIIQFLNELFSSNILLLKKAESINNVNSIDLNHGFTTSRFGVRYSKIFLLYIAFLSIDITNIKLIVIFSLIFLLIAIISARDNKVFHFTNKNFTIRTLFLNYDFQYSDIKNVKYYVAGRGSAQLRIYFNDGEIKKVSFNPSFYKRDDLVIKLILKSKVSFEEKKFRFSNYFD